MTWLIIGLGNPGRRYRLTKHNVGFRVVDQCAEKKGIKLKKRRLGKVQVGEGRVGAERVVIAKPLTYMNRSGSVVKKLIGELGISLDHLVVVHDDLDLACGRIKIKEKGGHGGHKGVRSIIEQIGSPDFVRVKVGIDKPETPAEGVDYVLSPFDDEQLPLVEESMEQASEAIEAIIVSGRDQAMSRYN
ncbi:MAG: aminoacyl-tRNA hydrolase [Deltaproteobacteria bacterium]|nr:aminoacyl-tRNA hydrolase [Deltaproteobacteria bacterium]